ncbi:molybdopterin-binding protein [Thermodesulfatator autotrophicus]|uniref:Molybdopterin molybdenumtransferase n=1 Tax=Thermodesulfatator autotrophicus TaxID=1795632 RepID=A0A177E5W7_9BACT|nr:molybdopterin-binding protein [Thermodesulfatator autotrophicus]OAG26881.1 molybdopterin-binding protein [Thermodesulfatator autotrophicus]
MKARTVPVEKAVGMIIPHDLTEIIPGKSKGPAFKKGHVIREEDVPRLKRMGKDHIYVLELEPDEIHEDEAALRLAKAVAGEGIEYDPNIKEGKVVLRAAYQGLFKVNTEALYQLNLLGEIMLSTRHSNFMVKKGEAVAAGRAIPLVVKDPLLDEVEKICSSNKVLYIKKPVINKVGLVITGNEVYYGRVEDAFFPALSPKLKSYGLEIIGPRFCPDNSEVITRAISEVISAGAEMVLVTGGMSVDPDDVTPKAIANVGVDSLVYGSPVLPGAMFLVAYKGEVPILGIPACGMYFKVTVLDLVLPRVICGEKLGREDMAKLGHGGFCLGCKECRYPVCPFGRGGL